MTGNNSTLGGLLGQGTMSTALPGTTTSGTTGGTVDTGTVDLSGLLGPDIATALTGGTVGDTGAPSFDPALFEPGGAYSPTGTALASTPQIAEAQQDPSGQVPSQQVDRTTKGDRATTQEQPQQTVDRTDKTDLATALGQPPAGPTGAPGDQTRGGDLGSLVRQAGGQPAAAPAAAAAGGAPGTLPQLARQQREAMQAAKAAQPSPVDQPVTQQPQPPAQQPAGGAQQPAASRAAATGGTPAPQPGAQPSAGPAGAAPAGVPPLLQAILNMLGLGGLTAARQPLQQVAGQAYPQRPIAPLAPTAGLGPLARARRAAGQYAQPSQDEWTRNMSSGRGLGPAPGSTDEVSAPTEQQVQQSRLAGTDTQPTAGFSPVLEKERGKFRTELEDPRTKWETLAVLSMEHAQDPAAVAESLLNRSDYSKTSLRNMIHSGFYGPVNFGKLGAEIRRLQANPQYAAKLNAGLETALRGSNLLGGATDQGSHNDPNVGHRGGRVIRFGETYNDWGGGPGGHDGAAAYRRAQQQRVRAGQQEAQRGQQFAMDITRRVPFTGGGAEMEPGGGMIRRGAPATEFENILEQLRKRRDQRQEAAAS